MSFAVVIEGMTLIAFVVMLAGGKQKRDAGWKILVGLLVLVGLIQCTGMALIVSFVLCSRVYSRLLHMRRPFLSPPASSEKMKTNKKLKPPLMHTNP